MKTLVPRSALWSSRHWLLAVLVLSGIGLFSVGNVDAQKPKAAAEKDAHDKKDSHDHPVHSAEEHARGVTALRQAFGGSQIDVYFEMGDLESLKPGLADVKFMDAVDVTGKELLRFERGGESWLIDPDTVFAYRMKKGK